MTPTEASCTARDPLQGKSRDGDAVKPTATAHPGGAPDSSSDAPARSGNPARVGEAAAAAMRTLASRPDRDPTTGQFVPGNTAAGVALHRSQALVELLDAARRELTAQVRADLAINGDAAATLEGMVEAYAEARLLRASMFARMVETGGPVTNKGTKRAIFDAFLSALDRERRLALDLGLRRVKREVSVEEWVRQRAAEAREARGD